MSYTLNEYQSDLRNLSEQYGELLRVSTDNFINEVSGIENMTEAEANMHLALFLQNQFNSMATLSESFIDSSDSTRDAYFLKMANEYRAKADSLPSNATDEDNTRFLMDIVTEVVSGVDDAIGDGKLGKFFNIMGLHDPFFKGYQEQKWGDFLTSLAVWGTVSGMAAVALGIMVLGAPIVAPVAITVGVGQVLTATALGLLSGYFMEALLTAEPPDERKSIRDLLDDALLGPDQAIRDFINAAFSWRRSADPLALDLDGDGIETTGTGDMILFDHDGDLNRNATGWIKGDDGFLVLDRNGNGKIDNGSELFGVDTVMSNGLKASSGFEALRDLDSNADGIFSSADALFGDVRVWSDLNQDGVSQADELKTLDELGIASINLGETASSTDLGNGNSITATSTFTRTDGTTGTAANLDLADTLAGLDGATRDQMIAQLGTVIRQWSDTSTMESSVEVAEDRGVKLVYVLPGQYSSDYAPFMGNFADYIMGNTESADLSSLSAADQQTVESLRAQQMQISSQMEILEHFNGNTFIRIPDTGTDFQTGAGASLPIYQYVVDPSDPVNVCYVTLSSTQIYYLDQAYSVLGESVYEGIVVQSRLETYQNDIIMGQDGDNFYWDY